MLAEVREIQQVFDPTLGRGIRPEQPIGSRYGLDDILGFFVYSHVDELRSFVARILSQIDKILEPGMPSVAAVGIRDNRITLYVNPEMLQDLTMGEVLFVIHHEVTHLMHDHIPRALEFRNIVAVDEATRFIFEQTANLAMDMAANAMLRKKELLAQDGRIGVSVKRRVVLPEQAGLPDLMDYEFYQEELLDEDKAKALLQSMIACGGEGASDDSPGLAWGGKPIPAGVPDVYKELAKKMGNVVVTYHRFTDEASKMSGSEREAVAREMRRHAKKIIKRAVKDQIKSCGKTPGEWAEEIEVWMRDTVVPWQELLLPAIASQMSNKRKPSMVRARIRKWPMFRRLRILPFPGSRRARKYRLIVIVDTSGSMASPELREGLTEIIALCRRDDIDVSLWVIECDASVQGVYLVKGDRIEPSFTNSFQIKGRGGTAFEPALHKAKELCPDAVVYYTDGEAPVPHNPLDCPLYWLISPKGKDPGLPGVVLHMGRLL